MGYGYKIPANQLGKWKNLWVSREYGLYLVCVRRELTVVTLCSSGFNGVSEETVFLWYVGEDMW